jgi:hypothetical protein
MTRVRWFVLFAVALCALALPATAWAARAADDPCPYPGTSCPPTNVAPENVATTTGAPSNVLAENAGTGGSSLPFTGGDIAGLTAIGGGAIVIGVVLARARKANSRS